jgi:hypothetical protein
VLEGACEHRADRVVLVELLLLRLTI